MRRRWALLRGWPLIVVANLITFGVLVAVDAAFGGWGSVNWRWAAGVVAAIGVSRAIGEVMRRRERRD